LLLVGALTLAGFPPFNVFVSEFLVFVAGLKAGYFWLMILCALFFTVTVAGLIQIVAGSVLGKAPETMPKGDVSWGALLPMVVLFGLILTMGVAVPQPISRLLQSATTVVLGEAASPVTAPWQTPAASDEQASQASSSSPTESNP